MPKRARRLLDAPSARSWSAARLWLGTLGNNAPFLGLFGTVIGVIQAFRRHMLGSSGAGGNQAAMGNVIVAISEALIATGVGLIVALPAVVGYNLTQKRVSTVENNIALIRQAQLCSRCSKPTPS